MLHTYTAHLGHSEEHRLFVILGIFESPDSVVQNFILNIQVRT